MSNTGTTDETPWDYVYSALFGNFAMDDETAQVYTDAVIEAFDGSSAFRIVPATAVPTADELDAIGALVRGDEWVYPDAAPAYRVVDVVRAYLERQR